jgi:hypothetical protein
MNVVLMMLETTVKLRKRGLRLRLGTTRPSLLTGLSNQHAEMGLSLQKRKSDVEKARPTHTDRSSRISVDPVAGVHQHRPAR